MDSNSASEHLQVIRTLMERSALYRRALAPVMIYAGVVGLAGAVIGRTFNIHQPASFVAFWYVVAAAALTGALLLVRRQAWKQAEPFWSPPTRRVAQALQPPLAAGFLIGLFVAALKWLPAAVKAALPAVGDSPGWLVLVALPLAWVILYGCALNAAGFFMARGMRLLGWLLILGGCGGLFVGHNAANAELLSLGYGLMGFFFGLLHLAYGVYLYFTEQRATTP